MAPVDILVAGLYLRSLEQAEGFGHIHSRRVGPCCRIPQLLVTTSSILIFFFNELGPEPRKTSKLESLNVQTPPKQLHYQCHVSFEFT